MFPNSEVVTIPSKGLEMHKVRQLLNSALGLEGLDQITGSFEDGLMEIGTQRFFDQQSIITLDHDVTELVHANHILDRTSEAENLRDIIMTVVEPAEWAGNGGPNTIAIVGSQLSVRAPERIQVQVIDYIERLRAIQSRRNHEAEKEFQEAVARADQEMQRTLESTRKRIAELQHELDELQDRDEAISYRCLGLEYGVIELEEAYRNEAPGEARDDLRNRLIGMRVEHESLKAQRKQMLVRIHTGQSRLDDLERSLELQTSAISGILPPRNQYPVTSTSPWQNAPSVGNNTVDIESLRREFGNRHPAVMEAERASKAR